LFFWLVGLMMLVFGFGGFGLFFWLMMLDWVICSFLFDLIGLIEGVIGFFGVGDCFFGLAGLFI